MIQRLQSGPRRPRPLPATGAAVAIIIIIIMLAHLFARIPRDSDDLVSSLHIYAGCFAAVTRHRLNTYGGRAFAVAGPTVWNLSLIHI